MAIKIKKILATQIFDSRGNPTISATVILTNGISGEAKVPSGASTGIHEALELRDGGKKYKGLGVLKAINNINKIIAPLLVGSDVAQQKVIDQILIKLDGTPDKRKLGANAILAVSLACAVAAAQTTTQPLYQYLRTLCDLKLSRWTIPKPLMNILNGGRHARWVSDFQEFMIVPQQAEFNQRMKCGKKVFNSLKKILQNKKLNTALGDEGGFAPKLKTAEQALDLLLQAIKQAGYTTQQVKIALDLAASEFYNAKTGRYELKNARQKLTSDQLIAYLTKLINKYPLVSLEDPLAEDDWAGWQNITSTIGQQVLLIGDDLFTTNPKRLEQGIALKAANAILIKVNQIGTVTETLTTIKLAKQAGYQIIISHRSGETNDTFIADLAVAVNAPYLKAGAPFKPERLIKYQRLNTIENIINK